METHPVGDCAEPGTGAGAIHAATETVRGLSRRVFRSTPNRAAAGLTP
jgi:hypothetical protein